MFDTALKTKEYNPNLTVMQTNLLSLSINLIDRSPYQMRQTFDLAEIEGLSASIERYGLLHPLIVRSKNDGRYELISGERRLRALQHLGQTTAFAILRKGESEATTAEVALTENLQRVNLSPIEVAKSYRSLMEVFSLTQEELSQRLGKPRSSIANLLRLLKLPLNIQESIDRGDLSPGHGKILLGRDQEEQKTLFHKIQSEKLPVRKLNQQIDPNLDFLEKELTNHFGRKVAIAPKGNGGTLTFHYESLEGLEALLDAFGVISDG